MSSYYDIDTILAEEELIPSTALFDFSHLAYLDPDARHRESHLPEGSQIKMPLWALERWSALGYVRMSLPRHFARKARERLEADPGDADSRKRNERFFQAGRMLAGMIERSVETVAKEIAAGKASRRSAQTRALESAATEAQELKRTLLTTFAGERLRRTFDWALSSGGDDDVSHYLSKLTEMERRLFFKGSSAVSAHEEWTMFGNRQYGIPKGLMMTPSTLASVNAVTPGEKEAEEGERIHPSKRRRTDA